ncbi:MAG: hypothetical protein K2N63_14335 [Lachnospiraceae bacterium]|nr:hypothetical protein [Lachnospiraceae bacterium]
MEKRSELLNLDTTHFHVFYEEADKNFAMKLFGLIEEFYLNICQKIHSSPGENVYELYICGSAENFIFYTGKTKEDYQDWMVGNTDMDKKRLCVVSPRAKGNLSESYEEYLIKVMLHEVVHIVFDSICRPEECEIWISEGIAVWLAGQTKMDYISEKDYPRIADLGGKEDMYAFADNGGYDYCGVYVWYLMELYGMEKFLSIYRGECALEDLLVENFEHRAVIAYRTQYGNG